jgi:23S rRNA pseudouridine1911/1915/1917 synthase
VGPNDGFEYTCRLGRACEGASLLSYLAERYPHSSREAWHARIESELVLIDGVPARPEATLRAGQELVWKRPPWDEPAAPLQYVVLHEDDDLLAVAKPAGLPTLPGANFLHATLLHQVRLRTPGAVPVHRLGRWTSGVVLFAKNSGARASLARQLAERAIGKRYRALAWGDPAWDERSIDVAIGPVPHAWLGTVHAASASGRPASSAVAVAERRDAEFLCDVRIATGRPHQIRIHLAAAGHPLVGDPLYAEGGLPYHDTRAVPGDGGYALHAAEVSLDHPATGRRITIASEPPPALRPFASRR